jgi:uncharacterized membrane protein
VGEAEGSGQPARETGETGDVEEAGDLPFGLERIVFFSDAVFAIAITLLALDVHLPAEAPGNGPGLTDAVLALVPNLVAYALSFGVIGLYWLAHWRRFDYIHRADERLAAINLLLLGCIALIPFPTSLIAEHGDQPAPIIVYALVISAAGVVGPASWLYAQSHGLTDTSRPVAWARLAALRGLVTPVVFLGSLPLLAISPYLVEAAWILIFPVQAVVVRELRRLEVHHSSS